MNGAWNTAYEISARRHETKRGRDHLSAKALSVLQAFAQYESAIAMRDAIGVYAFVQIEIE